MRSFELPDGRIVDLLSDGADQGPALLLHHGTPSDATLYASWSDAARRHGLQLIALSRPGYATSTRLPGRSVRDVARDANAVLDAFEVPWFVTAGWSGGGPHALATAHELGDRCRAAATLAGVGAYGVPDLDFLDGMGPENHAEFGAALEGEDRLRAWLVENASALKVVTAEEIVEAFGGLISDVDKAALRDGFANEMATELRRALARGFDGWIDDDLAFTKPWGFDLSAIAVPVAVWQGDRDLMVPAAHGTWLVEHIPTATAKRAPGHGHVSLFTTYRDEIVADLIAMAAR